MKILLVDNDEYQSLLIQDYLESLGYNVCVESNSANALKKYNIILPRLVLINISMLHMELIEKIRSTQEEWVPVICLIDTVAQQSINISVDDYIIKPIDNKILHTKIKLMSRIMQMQAELKAVQSIARETSKEINETKLYESMHDQLTKLPNRTFFEKHLNTSINNAKKTGIKLALVFLDLDGFKEINNTMGHHSGDNLIKIIAERLQKNIRTTDIVARIGGDEFMILLPDIKHEDNVAQVAQIIIRTICEPVKIDNKSIYISASLGIAIMPNDGEDAESLIKHADIAMYDAKQQGKNNFQFHSQELEKRANNHHKLVNDLKIALRQDQFSICFQPQIDHTENKIVSAETLLRWQHPQYGNIPPDVFIPIAEESRLITLIDRLVFEKMCMVISESFILTNKFKVAYNVSAKDLVQSTFIENLLRITEKYKIPPHKIQLELTEGIFVSDIKKTRDILIELKSYGFTLALDDFGTGYSCLSHLIDLPIDMLKIDKQFVMDVETDKRKQIMVKTLISLAKSLNIEVLAEGIENYQQAKFIFESGCNFMQGYLFSKPIPFDDLVKFINQNTWENYA